jgi:glycosyltransferase involved in cell wall biosynthesis
VSEWSRFVSKPGSEGDTPAQFAANGRSRVMNLVVFSHKPCWISDASPTGYVTDGGFPKQMQIISTLFSKTSIAVPIVDGHPPAGTYTIAGHNLEIIPLSAPRGRGWRRKILLPTWLLRNLPTLLSQALRSDAIHTPIPGDVGTIGMLLALAMRKRLFVRHCGNWFAPRTLAERFWKWSMERYAGGRNVMLATGGAPSPPSARNADIDWIFSTSLSSTRLATASPKTSAPSKSNLRLVTACRQEARKGTEKVIQALPELRKRFPGLEFDVIGDGTIMPALRSLVKQLGLERVVVFHGRLAQIDVLRVMAEAHLFCYPTSASEGFPKVVLEALASGLPVITTRVSVLPNLIDETCGFLLDDDSPASIVHAVDRCMANEMKYVSMSEAGVERARMYSLEAWQNFIRKKLEAAWGPLSSRHVTASVEAG